MIRLLFTVFFINALFGVFLFIKPTEIKNNLIFEIKRGDSYLRVVDNLKEIDITVPSFINVIIRYSSLDKKITYGDYLIKKQENLFTVLKKIIKSETHFRKYRIPEGSTISSILDRSNVPVSLKINGINFDKTNIHALEGRFHPNTYYYSSIEDSEDVFLEAILTQDSLLEKYWNSRTPYVSLQEPQELLVLASLIEKEACPNEHRKVAGVIYNRLRLNMPLQIDSSVIYGIEDFNGDIKKHHLRRDTPFNTYTNKGLPPMPISNPSESAINAASKPEIHSFLYFVAKDKCSHHFSETYDEHKEAIKKYQ